MGVSTPQFITLTFKGNVCSKNLVNINVFVLQVLADLLSHHNNIMIRCMMQHLFQNHSCSPFFFFFQHSPIMLSFINPRFVCQEVFALPKMLNATSLKTEVSLCAFLSASPLLEA